MRGLRNLVSHRNREEGYTTEVFYTGTDAVNQGIMLCYDRDTGTATNFDADRDVKVSKPDNTNNNSPAGVTIKAYTANADGQRVKVFVSGSVCKVRVKEATTIGDDSYLFYVVGGSDAGEFTTTKGFLGNGAAKCLQTQATADNLAQVELLIGAEPSGGVEFVTPAAAGGATALMEGGISILEGTVTLASAATDTLADGSYAGQKKGYRCTGTYATNDFVVTVTNGEQLNGTTDLATLSFDADDETSVLEFSGNDAPGWRLMHNAGTGLA